MSKLTDAALTLERHALKYEQLMNAAAELRKLGAIDDAANELQAKAEASRQELAKVTADLNEAIQAADRHAEALAAKQKEADTIYAKTIAEANARANVIVAQASDEAETIKGKASHEAERMRSEAQAFVNSLANKNAGLLADINNLAGRRDTAQSEADVAEERLAGIKEQIANLAKS